MSPPPTNPDVPDGGSRPSRNRPWWRPIFLVIAGMSLFLVAKNTTLPRTFDIQLKLAQPTKIQQLSLQWFEGPQFLKGVTFNLVTPPQRSILTSTVFVTPGRYRVKVSTQRPSGHSELERVIDLNDPTHPVIIPVP